jgi:CRP-like cAMP-binding protein
MSVVAMLKGHDLFRSLPMEDVEKISVFSSVKSYAKGDTVHQRGEPASHTYILVEGRVNLLVPGWTDEPSLVVARVGKGELFGIAPLLGAESYTSTAQCKSDCEVLTIEAQPLKEVLGRNAAVGLHLMGKVAQAYFERYTENLDRLQRILKEVASES